MITEARRTGGYADGRADEDGREHAAAAEAGGAGDEESGELHEHDERELPRREVVGLLGQLGVETLQRWIDTASPLKLERTAHAVAQAREALAAELGEAVEQDEIQDENSFTLSAEISQVSAPASPLTPTPTPPFCPA